MKTNLTRSAPTVHTIQLVAPSAHADQEKFTCAVDFLHAQGHSVYGVETGTRSYQRFAGTDTERLNDINALLHLDNEVDVVLSVRGGYGLSRLLPHIKLAQLAKKIQQNNFKLVGHSDFTALQLALMPYEIASYSGPMLVADFGVSPPNPIMLDSFNRALSGQALTYEFTSDIPATLETSGLLWGGNLAILCSLIGTPYLPKIQGGILVVEDVNEHPYRLERMLLQLHYAGILSQQRALILGDFSAYSLHAKDQGYDLSAMLEYLRAQLPIPIITGLPFGHIPNKLTLPFGQVADLKQAQCTVSLSCNNTLFSSSR